MRPAVTVLQLDTRFPRIPGDVACPETYTADVEILRIPRASVARVVSARPERLDIAPFEAALRQARGEVIVTSCGFLAPWQDHLQEQSDRPVVASALSALPRLSASLSPEALGILTFDAASLTARHLSGQASYLRSVIGLPAESHLRTVIAGDMPRLDADRAGAELVELAGQRAFGCRHLLLECTNLPPYKAALRAATGLPVTDILTEIERVRPGTVCRDLL